jgi:hypothetical protein
MYSVAAVKKMNLVQNKTWISLTHAKMKVVQNGTRLDKSWGNFLERLGEGKKV